MRFVEVKTEEQQSVLMLHRTRQLFVRQRTTLINAIRAHLAKSAGIGRNGVETKGSISVYLRQQRNACGHCRLSSCW